MPNFLGILSVVMVPGRLWGGFGVLTRHEPFIWCFMQGRCQILTYSNFVFLRGWCASHGQSLGMGLYSHAGRRALVYRNPVLEKKQSFGKANNYQLICPFCDFRLLYVREELCWPSIREMSGISWPGSPCRSKVRAVMVSSQSAGSISKSQK